MANTWVNSSQQYVNGSIKHELIRDVSSSAIRKDLSTTGYLNSFKPDCATYIVEMYCYPGGNGGTTIGKFGMLLNGAGGNTGNLQYMTLNTSMNENGLAYDFESRDNNVPIGFSGSNYGRKVVALHNVSSTTYEEIRMGAWDAWTNSSSSYPGYACYGYNIPVDYNAWATHTAVSGTRTYYAITIDGNSKFISATFSVSSGYRYVFKMATATNASDSGIVIAKASLNNAAYTTLRTNSNTLCYCSGNDGDSVPTGCHLGQGSYIPTANGTVYIYFKNGTSALALGEWDNADHDNFIPKWEQADIEIIKQKAITLSSNGGSATQYTYEEIGAKQSEMTNVSIPTRDGNQGTGISFTFKGYYDNLVSGTQYYHSDGTPAHDFDKTDNGSAIIFYAHWTNTINYVTVSSITTGQSTSTQNVTVATTVSCASGSTMTYDVRLWNGNTQVTGVTISSDGRTVTLPASLATGTYDIEIDVESTTSAGTNGYEKEANTYHVPLTVTTQTTITITLNRMGGSGSTSVNVLPGASSWSVSVPSRTGYTFQGYYSSNTGGGTQYTNSSGASVRSAPTSAMTLYAKWTNNISYTTSTSNLSMYCTQKAMAATTVDVSKTFTISSAGCTSTSGTTTAAIQSVSPSAAGGFAISTNGKQFTINQNNSSGTYIVTIRCTSPSGGTAGSNYYSGTTFDKVMNVTISPVVLNSIWVDTIKDTIKATGSTTLQVLASYSNNTGRDVGSQSTITFSNSGIAEVNKNIAIYIDDFPQNKDQWAAEETQDPDWAGWLLSNVLNGNCPEWFLSNKYYYTGQTFSYSGNTYYLWKYVVDDPEDGPNIMYLLTNTIDYNTLYQLSQEYNMDTNNYPVVARLKSDQQEYDNASDQLLLKVDQPGS